MLPIILILRQESRSEVHMLRGQLTKMEAQQIRDNEMISDEVSKCQLMLQEENKVQIIVVLS